MAANMHVPSPGIGLYSAAAVSKCSACSCLPNPTHTALLACIPCDQGRPGPCLLLQPDYTAVNQLYLTGKTRNWAAGSLESLVESVVKTLEMEISHKVGEGWGVQGEGGKAWAGPAAWQRCG
jgi:hypothetical protein